MAVMEPNYTQYPTQTGGALVPSGSGGAIIGGGAIVPGGESDSGLPGSQGVPSNFITDLLGPTYKKYPLPAYTLSVAPPATPPTVPPSREPRGGGLPPVA